MDSEYLKQHVGDALTRGLVEISQKRPNDPIEYLGFWLRKYVENRDYDLKKQQELVQLEQEREEYEIEQKRLQAMEEEQKLIARQEAYEKAAAEPIVVTDTKPRPMPPEVTESLPTLVEGDEEEKKPEDGPQENVSAIENVEEKETEPPGEEQADRGETIEEVKEEANEDLKEETEEETKEDPQEETEP
eukprot:gene12301-13570_t